MALVTDVVSRSFDDDDDDDDDDVEVDVFGEPRDDADVVLSPDDADDDDDVMGTNGGMSLGAGALKPPFGESSPLPGEGPSFFSLAVLDRPFSSPEPDFGVSDLASLSF